jgi:hypothetical protein
LMSGCLGIKRSSQLVCRKAAHAASGEGGAGQRGQPDASFRSDSPSIRVTRDSGPPARRNTAVMARASVEASMELRARERKGRGRERVRLATCECRAGAAGTTCKCPLQPARLASPEQRAVLPAPAVRRQAQAVKQHWGGEEGGEGDHEEGKHHDLQHDLSGGGTRRATEAWLEEASGHSWRLLLQHPPGCRLVPGVRLGAQLPSSDRAAGKGAPLIKDQNSGASSAPLSWRCMAVHSICCEAPAPLRRPTLWNRK